MTTDITIKQNNVEMLATLRHSVAPGLSEQEFMLFSEIVKATGLNPITKEVWAIKAGGRLQIMTGINGFLRIANSHPQYDGMEVTYEWDGKNLLAATAKVYRKDRRFPSVATAFMSEYAKPSPIWKQMPSIMLAKCAKSLAIREAFPQELNGLYTQEEMPNEYAPPVVRDVTPQKTKPMVSPVEVIDTNTGEVKVEEDDVPAWDKPEGKKPRKAVPTRYDISALEGEKFVKATAYLTDCLCRLQGDGTWLCPTRLDKLTSCVVEEDGN